MSYVWQLPDPIESATHVQLGQLQQGSPRPTLHVRVTFGTLDTDGEFVAHPMLRRGEVRILPGEFADFQGFQRDQLGVPDAVRASNDWRIEDLCRYMDARGLWSRVF